jgi:Tol biopolymer transport system component
LGSSDPALSGDGTQLAFVGPGNGTVALWTLAIGRGEARLVPNAPIGAIVANPTWCKGGDSVVVASTVLGNSALIVASTTTGGWRPLTDGSAHDVNPACGPDGQSVVFASTRNGDLGLFVSSGGAGAEAIRRLDAFPATDGEPTWLPDGRVVFVQGVGGATARLVWIDPSFGDSVTAIPVPGAGGPAHPRPAPMSGASATSVVANR